MVQALGFVGLGIMGQAMAKNLYGAEPLTVYNRTRERTRALQEMGARVVDTPRQAASASQICFIMVSNDEALRQVTLGEDGVLAGMSPGSIVVDHSTVSPAITKELGGLAQTRGVFWCDAPVTGGDVGAQNATLTVMAGGEAVAIERIGPYVARMSQRLVHVGALGQGQTMKLVSNLIGGLNLMAAAEGLSLGLAAGLSVEALEAVLPNGTAASFELQKILDRHRSQDFAPGFSVENRYKDLDLAVELARQLGQMVPLGETALDVFGRHRARGYSKLDESSYLKGWER